MTDRCEICGEGFIPETKGDGKAEMIPPENIVLIEQGLMEEDDEELSVICHHVCGITRGYLIA